MVMVPPFQDIFHISKGNNLLLDSKAQRNSDQTNTQACVSPVGAGDAGGTGGACGVGGAGGALRRDI